jgi:hypothetical protein
MSKRTPMIISMLCRRDCGKRISTLSGPMHSTITDYKKYHGICDDCLTDEEKADMRGAMLLRTARNVQGRYR